MRVQKEEPWAGSSSPDFVSVRPARASLLSSSASPGLSGAEMIGKQDGGDTGNLGAGLAPLGFPGDRTQLRAKEVQ